MWKAGALTTPIDHASTPYRLLIRGDWNAARAAWLERDTQYEAALALGESDNEADLRTAISELARLGAKPAIAEVTRRMRARGASSVPRGPRPKTRQNPGGLTPRLPSWQFTPVPKPRSVRVSWSGAARPWSARGADNPAGRATQDRWLSRSLPPAASAEH
jgi:hypothetical protein